MAVRHTPMARLQRIDAAPIVLLVLLGSALSALVPIPSARAQTEEEAQRLFREGIALREAGDAAGAIDRLRSAHRIDPSDRTAYNLAAALADGGRVVEARSLLRRIIASPRELLIVDAARDLLARVSPRIARVSLTIESEDPEVRLLVDGATSSTGPGGARAVSLDPGRHRFEVRDPAGTVLARSDVEVGEGERRALVL
ncbi:MAG: hypothetical protein M3Y87_37500, partial [Myxococcota bacterium]|nr:hypothetical protein [Myxococcota bacterium]